MGSQEFLGGGASTPLLSVLDEWRDSLIDLTRRNRLLNFVARPTSAVTVTSPTPQAIVDRLVANAPLRFRALLIPHDDADDGLDQAPHLCPVPDASCLDVEVEPIALDRTLRTLHRRASAEFLDRGLSVLYLSLGALRWTDVDGQLLTSPLLLVPVDLDSTGRGQPWRLSLGDADVVLNAALSLKLTDFDIELPAVDTLEDINVAALLDVMRDRIAGQAGWAVDDRVVLSYFAFAKEAMYRDLLDNEALVQASPIVHLLAGGAIGQQTDRALFDPITQDALDEQAPPEQTPLVKDADTSQRICVAAALAGRSFVMDGPPGTGKSQTIANIIGALLHEGRSVLFVSEKAAALDVVRNRLADVGLDPFLLELHSHKATRRDVAVALGTALDRRPIVSGAMTDLERKTAKARREELTAYALALNGVREPLGVSLHTVLGWIATLHAAPAAPAPPISPQGLDADLLTNVRRVTAALARAWRPALQGQAFPWRDVVERGSLDAVLYEARRSLHALTALVERVRPLAAAFDLLALHDAAALAQVLDLAQARPPLVPGEWLHHPHIQDVLDQRTQLAQHLTAARQADALVEEQAGFGWRQVPDRRAADLIPDTADSLLPPALPIGQLTADEAWALAAGFEQDTRMLERRRDDLSQIADLFGVPAPETFDEAAGVLRLATHAFATSKPQTTWLTAAGLDTARTVAGQLRAARHEEAEAQSTATQTFTPDVLTVRPAELLARFTTVHRGLRRFRKACRDDRRTLAALLVPGAEVPIAVTRLPHAVAWEAAQSCRLLAEEAAARTLGAPIPVTPAEAARLEEAFGHAQQIIDLIAAYDPARVRRPQLEQQLCTARDPHPALGPTLAAINQDLDDWRSRLGPGGRCAPTSLMGLSLAEAAAWLDAQAHLLRRAAEPAEAVSRAVGRRLTVDAVGDLLSARAAAAEAQARLDAKADSWRAAFGDLYHGIDTDLSLIDLALDWATTMRGRTGAGDAPLTVEQTQRLLDAAPVHAFREACEAWSRSRESLVRLFAEKRATEIRETLNDWADAEDFVNDLAEDPGGRDEWLAYVDAVTTLQQFGIDAAVSFCAAERLPAELVPATVERALLQGWADGVIAADPGLGIQRSQDRDALVREFQELDRQLVATAVAEIVDSVNSRRPRNDVGQSATIRTEAAKKRRHMPVRVLLGKTRDVAQAIKPCFMMSPLSVSQFLPADLTFDVVIFDEASQVPPADALNCAYRGRALIVAGDQKQLPPTNFFATTGGGDDGEDWDPDATSSQDFDSLLDIAKGSGSLTSLTLRWHYRSRHEGLIAFSNASFYDGRLITFPGATETSDDVGVQLIKVPGTYRRGTSRDNPVEAERVAQRVIHHFDSRPGLTLGVVTFSEAQADAVEVALDAALADRPDLEAHRQGDRLDGFFVKNLEAVQGDERDVIIFSVGYGPDENRKTTMNFGPLNKAGGWRRLNVAVTRARHRVEIVSSIGAEDISEGSNESVRHFRRYLDYAARGPAALALDVGGGGDVESPFEASVLNVVRSWGYDVVPQVGAGGYRIDLGVRHPDHPGVFAIGVECDGYMYHSSRAARDRDRLREQVLVKLGWRLHRIWGTAWYRDRVGEEARLREAVEEACRAAVHGRLTQLSMPEDRPVVETVPVVLPEQWDWASLYAVATVPALSAWVDPSGRSAAYDMKAAVSAVAQVEGPVHIDILCQRLRDSWGIGRIGSRIRANIVEAIRYAGLTFDGEFVDIPDRGDYTVRTPVGPITRRVDEIHPGELSLALVNLVTDSRGLSEEELTQAVARLYGWGRRGPDITARLRTLIQNLLDDGRLVGDSTRLTLP